MAVQTVKPTITELEAGLSPAQSVLTAKGWKLVKEKQRMIALGVSCLAILNF